MVNEIVILFITGALFITIIIVICAVYTSHIRQLRADRDHWSTSYENLQEFMQPMIDYLIYCQKTGQEMNDSSCRAYFYATGRDYDYWIAQWINQQQLQAYR